MAKKKILTREEKLEQIRSTFKEVETATGVKAWVFIIEKQHYVVIKYFASRMGDCTAVFQSNRKGIKTSNDAIYEKKFSKDYMDAFEQALQILVPEVDETVTEEISVENV
jgi:hypothetical protein